MAKKRRRTARDKLLFIDTNIFLDFYRVRSEAGLSLLNHIDNLHDQIITTTQVEMEFKKNRLGVIRESLRALKALDPISPPAFLADGQAATSLKSSHKKAHVLIKRMKDKMTKVLANPTTLDPVYKVAQRLFNSKSELNLTRNNEAWPKFQRLGFKRFIQGCPPRKKSDTAIGDSVNWEWIIQCATGKTVDVVIVSRDSDFGIMLNGNCYVNDWLRTEYKNRVSKQGNVILTDKLSSALKLISVTVTPEEEQEEARTTTDSQKKSSSTRLSGEEFLRLIRAQLDALRKSSEDGDTSKSEM